MKFTILVRFNPDIEARLVAASTEEMKDQIAAEVANDALRKGRRLEGLRRPAA